MPTFKILTGCTDCCTPPIPSAPCCGTPSPYDICVGSDNCLYVSDTGWKGVWKITTSGQKTLLAGFSTPGALCLGPDGRVWCCDGDALWAIATDGTKVAFTGLNYNATPGLLAGPQNHDICSVGGFLYVTNNFSGYPPSRVPPGPIIPFEGTNNYFWQVQTDGTKTAFLGDNAAVIVGSSVAQSCAGDPASGDLWIAYNGNPGNGGSECWISEFSGGSLLNHYLVGSGAIASLKATLGNVNDIAIDSAGGVWATNHTINGVTFALLNLSKIAAKGTSFYLSDGTNPTPLSGICSASSGDLWAADPNGFLWDILQSGAGQSHGGFYRPLNLIEGPDGRIWVADSAGFVWAFDPSTGQAVCIGLPIPNVVHAHFTDLGGCSSLDGMTVPLSFIPPATATFAKPPYGARYGTLQLSSPCPKLPGNNYIHFMLFCGGVNKSSFGIYYYIDDTPGLNPSAFWTGPNSSGAFAPGPNVMGSASETLNCDPFLLAFNEATIVQCCGGTLQVTVTE